MQGWCLWIFGIEFGKEGQNFEGPKAGGGVVASKILNHFRQVRFQGLQAKDRLNCWEVLEILSKS